MSITPNERVQRAGYTEIKSYGCALIISVMCHHSISTNRVIISKNRRPVFLAALPRDWSMGL